MYTAKVIHAYMCCPADMTCSFYMHTFADTIIYSILYTIYHVQTCMLHQLQLRQELQRIVKEAQRVGSSP